MVVASKKCSTTIINVRSVTDGGVCCELDEKSARLHKKKKRRCMDQWKEFGVWLSLNLPSRKKKKSRTLRRWGCP